MLLKRHARRSKFEPLVDEVDLVSVNPTSARVRFEGGREVSVSLRDVAPLPQLNNNKSSSLPGTTVNHEPAVITDTPMVSCESGVDELESSPSAQSGVA